MYKRQDKNETISARELFQYAERAVAKHYENEKLLASEHSRLSGDAADTFELARYGSLVVNQSEIPEELITRRNEISSRITTLRNRKSDLAEDEYFDQLQSLMLELATVQRDIDSPATQPTEVTPGEQTPEQSTEQPEQQNGQATVQSPSSANSTNPASSVDEEIDEEITGGD